MEPSWEGFQGTSPAEKKRRGVTEKTQRVFTVSPWNPLRRVKHVHTPIICCLAPRERKRPSKPPLQTQPRATGLGLPPREFFLVMVFNKVLTVIRYSMDRYEWEGIGRTQPGLNDDERQTPVHRPTPLLYDVRARNTSNPGSLCDAALVC